MRTLLVVSILTLTQCVENVGGSSERPPFDGTVYDNRVYLWNSEGVLGVFEIVGQDTWRYENRTFSQWGLRYQTRTVLAMPSRDYLDLRPTPGSERQFAIMTNPPYAGDPVPHDPFDDSPGHAALMTGRRLLLYGERSAYLQDGVLRIMRAWRMRDNGAALDEPALGFPAGTPASTVLDTTTLRNQLDGATSAPADASADSSEAGSS